MNIYLYFFYYYCKFSLYILFFICRRLFGYGYIMCLEVLRGIVEALMIISINILENYIRFMCQPLFLFLCINQYTYLNVQGPKPTRISIFFLFSEPVFSIYYILQLNSLRLPKKSWTPFPIF